VNFSQVNLLLDFTLFNFKQDVPLYQIKDSSSLLPLHSRRVRYEPMTDEVRNSPQFKRIQEAMSDFYEMHNEFKNLKLENLLEPLSEIIRINPEHSHDKNIAEKIFSKIFWQYWQKMLQAHDHNQLAGDFNKMF